MQSQHGWDSNREVDVGATLRQAELEECVYSGHMR